jgi:hypothetical protein
MLFAAVSLFFLKRKETEGRRESGRDADATCRSVRREGKKKNKRGRKGGNESRRAHSLEEADKRVRRKKKDEWVERCAPTARRCRAAVSTTRVLKP